MDIITYLNNNKVIVDENITRKSNKNSIDISSQLDLIVMIQSRLMNNKITIIPRINSTIGKDVENLPGSGAAGGLGAGFLAFSNCQMNAGAQIVIEESHLAEKMRDADYVFTGEGGIDFQTKFGKTPYAVAQTAKNFGLPVFALAGQVGEGIELSRCNTAGAAGGGVQPQR